MPENILNYPAPDPVIINWMYSETLARNQKISDAMIAKVSKVHDKEEYFVTVYNETNHVRFDRELGSCACKKFTYTSDKPADPCIHLIKTRSCVADGSHTSCSDQLIASVNKKIHDNKKPEKKESKETKTEQKSAETSTKSEIPSTPTPPPTAEPVVMPLKYICQYCDTQISESQAHSTVTAYDKPMCKSCEAEERKTLKKSATSQTPKQPLAQNKPSTPTPQPTSSPPEKTQTPQTDTKIDLITTLKEYVGDDVIQIFGDSGTGKSAFCVELAKQALAKGLKVFYLDTERNLTREQITSMKGIQYQYTPVMSEINQITQKLPEVNVIILDSIGFPVLTKFARLNMKDRGTALLNLIAVFGDLKEWAYKNKGLAIITNQPESDFAKEPGHILRPFGDKSQFAAKEIWKSELIKRGSPTQIAIKAFRSRSMGYDTKILKMNISNTGVTIEKEP